MRNLGVGAGNFAAGIALIIVPYLWLLVSIMVTFGWMGVIDIDRGNSLFQEKTQIYLPMTIMGCFGLIGGTALIILEDRSPSVNTEETNTTEEETTTNDDDNNQDDNQDDNTEEEETTTTNNNNNNDNDNNTTNNDNTNDDNNDDNDQDQTDGHMRTDNSKSRIPRLKKDKINSRSTTTDV